VQIQYFRTIARTSPARYHDYIMSRKHNHQMNQEEKAFVVGYTRKHVAPNVNAARQHFYDRATERSFSFNEAKSVLVSGTVIEVHNNAASEVRALFRNKEGVCVVVSLTDWTIVTVYYNAPDDTHQTLDYNAYRWSVNLVDVIKSLRRAA
jgi:hypothetical protein